MSVKVLIGQCTKDLAGALLYPYSWLSRFVRAMQSGSKVLLGCPWECGCLIGGRSKVMWQIRFRLCLLKCATSYTESGFCCSLLFFSRNMLEFRVIR